MIGEDDTNNPHHEHVQAPTTHGSEENVDEPSLEDPLGEHFAQSECD